MVTGQRINSIVYTEKFEREVRRIKDSLVKERVAKQIRKIVEDPEMGKLLRYSLKGEWTIRVKPYRLIHAIHEDKMILLRLEHRKEVCKS